MTISNMHVPARWGALVFLLALPALAMPPKGASAKARAKRDLAAALLAPAPAALRRPAKNELRPGADLSRCDLSGMEVPGVDLRDANLDDSDLVGANLAGANLARATLRRARMTGTFLQGACLLRTNFSDAVGANVSGAQLHPFFDTEPEEAGKDTSKFLLLGPDQAAPSHLEITGTGGLVLQEFGSHRNWILSPHGIVCSFASPDPTGAVQHALGRDGRKRLWAFMEQGVAIFPDADVPSRLETYGLPKGLKGVTATAAGEGSALYASATLPEAGGSVLLTLETTATKNRLRCATTMLGERAFQSLAAMPGLDSKVVLGVHPSRDEITVLDLAGGHLLYLPLPKDSRPLRVVPGAPGKVWFLASGTNTVGLVEVVGGELSITRTFYFGPKDKGDARLRGLACAPDGTVWVTAQSRPLLGRIAPDFERTQWALRGGIVPGEIVCGRDGKVYFTLVGRAMLGSFRPAGPLAVPGDASSSSTAPPPQASVAMPRLNGKVRREKALNRELPTVEEVEANLEPAAPQSLEEKKVPIPIPVPEGKGEEPAVLPAPIRKPELASPTGSSWDLLESMDLHLGEERITHILQRHSHDSAGGRGRFTAEASTREGLVALLAKGLAQAGEPGRVLKRYDPRGILHTPCWMDAPVGRYQSHGQWKETNCFDVVTLRVRLEDGTATQVVLSAYPVNPRKF
jgi:hypothetical protein